MADTRLHWGAEALFEQLQPHLPDISIEIAASLPSTNSTLLERARAGSMMEERRSGEAAPAMVRRSVESGAFGRRAVDWQPCLLVAEQQTAGRGRMGREWFAEPLASLTFSLAMPLAPADWAGLSLVVAVVLADALDPPALGRAPMLGIKWPNDLWLLDANTENRPGRKLGGILIETLSAGSKRLAVTGIGINISRPPPMRKFQASSGFACLQEIDPAASAPLALARIALPLVSGLREFERAGFAGFAQRFAARDLLRDQPVTSTQSNAQSGVARGVAADGSLIIETAAGRVALHSGEVSVRLAPEASGC